MLKNQTVLYSTIKQAYPINKLPDTLYDDNKIPFGWKILYLECYMILNML